MRLPKIDTTDLKDYETLIENMDIPTTITFTPHPEDEVTKFREIAALPIEEAYKHIHIKFDEKRRQVLLGEAKNDILSRLWVIESDYTTYDFRNKTLYSDRDLFTEVLIFRLQTLDIDYPLILAAAYLTPRKEYSWQEFCAAYYICVLKEKINSANRNSKTKFYDYLERLRQDTYKNKHQPEENQGLNVEDPIVPSTDGMYSLNKYPLNKSPLPRYIYTKYISPEVELPMFIYARWGIEYFAVIPTQATTANKLLEMIGHDKNNLLRHNSPHEDIVLNLHKQINQFNLPNILELHTNQLYPLPEVIDINTLLNTPPTGKKADQFLKYPIIRKDR